MPRIKGIAPVVLNKKARHEYFIENTYEAGLELLGSEIKSIRLRECTLDAAYVRFENGQAYLFNMHINPYIFNTHTAVEPARTRRLLLHKREINKLSAAADIKGYTVVPLEVFIKNGWAKVKIGLAKGKKQYDKRDTIKKRDLARETERGFKNKIKF
ncbi:MAG: SsrA-binding protein SmpB [Elusimicrobiota bacterium]|jgi:SsrA-binding protein|nr:SsrA-binding protein SmpB [Elusimicrobiota bacterium]